MSFNTNVPNASQSPGLFPAQNGTNFTRLKAIIDNDHLFNDTADAATDGRHKQVTLRTRSDPMGAVSGGALILYTKLDSSGRARLFTWNGTQRFQLTPTFTETRGSVDLTDINTYQDMTTIETDSFGYFYMYRDTAIQAGTFVSDGTTVYGFSYREGASDANGRIFVLAANSFNGATNLLNLRVARVFSAPALAGSWNFRVFQRKKDA